MSMKKKGKDYTHILPWVGQGNTTCNLNKVETTVFYYDQPMEKKLLYTNLI